MKMRVREALRGNTIEVVNGENDAKTHLFREVSIKNNPCDFIIIQSKSDNQLSYIFRWPTDLASENSTRIIEIIRLTGKSKNDSQPVFYSSGLKSYVDHPNSEKNPEKISLNQSNHKSFEIAEVLKPGINSLGVQTERFGLLWSRCNALTSSWDDLDIMCLMAGAEQSIDDIDMQGLVMETTPNEHMKLVVEAIQVSADYLRTYPLTPQIS